MSDPSSKQQQKQQQQQQQQQQQTRTLVGSSELISQRSVISSTPQLAAADETVPGCSTGAAGGGSAMISSTASGVGSLRLDDKANIVLVAINGTDQAEAAVQWYIDHLHKEENTLLLAYVAAPPTISASGLYVDTDVWKHELEAKKKLAAEIERKYEHLLINKGINGRIRAVFDTKPAEAIIEMARKERVRYIVTGTRGLGKLKRTIQGSVSDHILHNVHCPIMICRFADSTKSSTALHG